MHTYITQRCIIIHASFIIRGKVLTVHPPAGLPSDLTRAGWPLLLPLPLTFSNLHMQSRVIKGTKTESRAHTANFTSHTRANSHSRDSFISSIIIIITETSNPKISRRKTPHKHNPSTHLHFHQTLLTSHITHHKTQDTRQNTRHDSPHPSETPCLPLLHS